MARPDYCPVGNQPSQPPAQQVSNMTDAAGEYLDAWKCERCHGKGWHWQSESVNHGKEIGVENVDLRTHCDACEGSGWRGPDAALAAQKTTEQGGS